MNQKPVKEKPETKEFKTTEDVIKLMRRVAQWQIDNLPLVMELPCGIIEPITAHHWVRAAFFSGIYALFEKTNDDYYVDFLMDQCREVDFQLGERIRHADEYAIGKLYTDLFLLKKDKSIIQNLIDRIDEIITNPTKGPEVGWSNEQNWAWCDAIFMAPPAWVKLFTCTGKRKYLNTMNDLFWETVEYLYSNEDCLFYRDGSFKLDENGKGPKSSSGDKIFWSRGNGWVVGGLCELLTYIPGDFPDRPRYERLFQDIMDKVISLQAEDGMWRSSLLDPTEYPNPEFSGSVFFALGMAWGINHRMLDPEIYMPYLIKSWKGLLNCIDENGRVNWVQRVGSDPNAVKESDTMEYGAGAFLLLCKEIIELIESER